MNVNTQALATVSPNGPTIRAAITPSFGNGPGTVARNLELISWAESIGDDDVWLAEFRSCHD